MATGLAVAAIAATVVGAGVSYYGQQQAAKATERASAYNANLASIEARNRELEGAEARNRQRIANRRRMATIRARLAHGGTHTASGTPLAILSESQSNLDLGIQDAARATGIEASRMRAQGQMGLWEGSQQAGAMRTQSYGSLLSGLSSAGSQTSRFRYSGAI